jgi:hypothetical protein
MRVRIGELANPVSVSRPDWMEKVFSPKNEAAPAWRNDFSRYHSLASNPQDSTQETTSRGAVPKSSAMPKSLWPFGLLDTFQ